MEDLFLKKGNSHQHEHQHIHQRPAQRGKKRGRHSYRSGFAQKSCSLRKAPWSRADVLGAASHTIPCHGGHTQGPAQLGVDFASHQEIINSFYKSHTTDRLLIEINNQLLKCQQFDLGRCFHTPSPTFYSKCSQYTFPKHLQFMLLRISNRRTELTFSANL